jgi:hypothetical protein
MEINFTELPRSKVEVCSGLFLGSSVIRARSVVAKSKNGLNLFESYDEKAFFEAITCNAWHGSSFNNFHTGLVIFLKSLQLVVRHLVNRKRSRLLL